MLRTVAEDGFAAVGLPVGRGWQGRCTSVLQLTVVALRDLVELDQSLYGARKEK
jgi:hypothetical protein